MPIMGVGFYIFNIKRKLYLSLPLWLVAINAVFFQFGVRHVLLITEGEAAVGVLSASLSLTGIIIAVISAASLNAMLPRISTKISLGEDIDAFIAHQTRLSLLLFSIIGGVVLFFDVHIIKLLFSDQFSGVANILAMLIVGELFKICSWPLGYILIATGKPRQLAYAEFAAILPVFVVSLIVVQYNVVNSLELLSLTIALRGLLLFAILKMNQEVRSKCNHDIPSILVVAAAALWLFQKISDVIF